PRRLIPCPAALVVLLTALSMHRVGFGLVLIVAFSVGLAAVLVAIGVLMVYAGRLLPRFKEAGPLIRRWLPLTSSAVMTLLGFGIAIQAVVPWIRGYARGSASGWGWVARPGWWRT